MAFARLPRRGGFFVARKQKASGVIKPAFTQVLHGKGTVRSVRTEGWRYTEWNGGKDGVELYDHDTDPQEWHNLGLDAKWATTREELKALPKENFKPIPEPRPRVKHPEK
ncbi:MAG: sulfatase [Pedosphaera sp.]|nr:sulfatase [Pedosphaera sp.]